MLPPSLSVLENLGRWRTSWLLAGALALFGCDNTGSVSALRSPIPDMLSNVTRVDEHPSCPGSAALSESGFDWNENGELDADEIETTRVLCDEEVGSCTIDEDSTKVTIDCPGRDPVEVDKAPPSEGGEWLVVITPGAPAEECPAGGYTVRSGRDVAKPKGVLDDEEVETTSYACHAYCGDESVDAALGEECDDGNDVLGDGCDAQCRLEPSCAPPTPDPACPAVDYFIDAIGPGVVPTAGTAVTLHGSFPETATPENVVATWTSSGAVLEVSSAAADEIVVNIPAGVVSGAFTLEVDGWPIPYLSKQFAYDGTWSVSVEDEVPLSYAPPTLAEVSGCPVQEGVSTAQCSLVGGTVLTLTGNDFGDAPGAISVTIGGQACGSVAVVTPHSVVTCVLPPNPGGAFDLPVTVTVGGRSTTTTSTSPRVSYAGPTLLPATLNLVGNPPSSDVELPDTLGGHLLELFVQDLGTTDPAQVQILFVNGDYEVACPATNVAPTVGTDAIVTCRMQPGFGRDLAPVVYVAGLRSRPGSDRLHHPAPVIHPSSLRLDPVVGGSSDVLGSRSGEEDVYFDVSHVRGGSGLVVTYGPPEQPNLYRCVSVQVTDETLRCRTAFGSGGPYVFSVQVPGGATAVGTDQFTYPAAPVLERLLGCAASDGASTSECPTEGDIYLYLEVSGVGPDAVVRVGSEICTSLVHINAGTLSCVLPPGVGKVDVTVEQGFLRSNPVPVFYADPEILSVSGCAPSSGNTTVDCPASGGEVLTINGRNFGASGATVFVGSSPCTNVQHSLVNPHRQLTCTLPPGSGTNQMLRVVNGGVSAPFAIHYVTP